MRRVSATSLSLSPHSLVTLVLFAYEYLRQPIVNRGCIEILSRDYKYSTHLHICSNKGGKS